MNPDTFLSLLAALAYLYALAAIALRMWLIGDENPHYRRRNILIALSVGILLHAMALKEQVWPAQHGPFTLNLGITLSLIGFSATLSLLLVSLTKPTEGLGIFVLPIALTGLAASPFDLGIDHPLPPEYGAHALLALLAYAALALATAQAILFWIQEKHFKRQRLNRLIASLPPLQVMERTLYQLLLGGFVILTLTLMTGALFIRDPLARPLMHKTVFAALSWTIYATLLWGRFFRGWRGRKGAALTIVAFVLLALSYVGTQFVLEILLKRP